MRAGLTAIVVASQLLLAGSAPAAEPGHADSIAVVVGTRSDIAEVTLDTLRELYLRRRRVWPDGSRVIPVNLPPDSDARQRFS